MKKLLFFATMLAMLLPMACENIEKDDDYVLIDWAPIQMYIYVSDADGNNLLDPTSDKCYDSTNIILSYNGKQYSVENVLREDYEPQATPFEYLRLSTPPVLRPWHEAHDTVLSTERRVS